MYSHEIEHIKVLAQSRDIIIPQCLERLIRDGHTCYGENYEHWQNIWRERSLHNPPALLSAYDFEWLHLHELISIFENWLTPEHQNKQLLPFAMTGAGDAYCLIPIKERVEVALCQHDSGKGFIVARSFDDFVYKTLIATFADFSHMSYSGFNEQEAQKSIIADVKNLIKYLPKSYCDFLQKYMNKAVLNRTINYGKRQEVIPALITEDEEKTALSIISNDILSENFPVKCQWEIE